MRILIISLAFLFLCPKSEGQKRISGDICVYGATSGGVIAAYSAARLGKKVILVSPATHPGGLSSGGLGNTDIGNKIAITGLARDFYHRVGVHYGKPEQWIFEPHVAEDIFNAYIREAHVHVLYSQILQAVHKKGTLIQEIQTGAAVDLTDQAVYIIEAKEYIDCSYEGDLMAQAGVDYTIGRESNSQYHENHNGVQLLDKHQFPDGVDPYVIPGKPETGLVWGVSLEALSPRGSGDNKVQAYNFRLCLTDSLPNQIAITQPAEYDRTRYELLLRYLQIKNPKQLEDGILNINLMPGHKTDINNNGPFSTDMIGMNYRYPEANTPTRYQIIREHTNYIKGLLYFLSHDERVPAPIKMEMSRWGYPKDEFQDNDHFTPQLYIRESRRMRGEYIMTEANCTGSQIARDGIGMAAYTMDSHNCQRIVVNGMVKNEGDVQIGGFPPYPVSYRAIVPKKKECTNLLVPVCLSASHIAYGSIRMEPVFMVLGQSAAFAAAMAIQWHLAVQDLPVDKLQKELKENPLANHLLAL